MHFNKVHALLWILRAGHGQNHLKNRRRKRRARRKGRWGKHSQSSLGGPKEEKHAETFSSIAERRRQCRTWLLWVCMYMCECGAGSLKFRSAEYAHIRWNVELSKRGSLGWENVSKNEQAGERALQLHVCTPLENRGLKADVSLFFDSYVV